MNLADLQELLHLQMVLQANNVSFTYQQRKKILVFKYNNRPGNRNRGDKQLHGRQKLEDQNVMKTYAL